MSGCPEHLSRREETPMANHLQVFCTTDSREEAEAIAEKLVREELAACVQIAGPITSVYRWQGAVER
ncbi:MAG: divalent cation tolerance protein CutA, partial [Armatimonadota bacterium]